MSINQIEKLGVVPLTEAEQKVLERKIRTEEDPDATARHEAIATLDRLFNFIADESRPQQMHVGYFILDESIFAENEPLMAYMHAQMNKHLLEQINQEPEEVLASPEQEVTVLSIDDVVVQAQLLRTGPDAPVHSVIYRALRVDS